MLTRVPWSIPALAGLLLLMGLTALDRGDELYGGEFTARQTVWGLLSLPALLAAMAVPYRVWRPLSPAGFWGSLALLAAVYFLPAKYGSHRWIPLGVINLQPSEPAKLAFILMLAQHLMFERNHRRLMGLLQPFVLAGLPLVLILKEPDLGTSLLFIPVLFAMLYAAGARGPHLVLIVVCGIAAAPALWRVMSAEQRSRVTAVFRQQDGGPAPRGDEYHQHQSKQLLALGGTFGSEVTGPAVADPLAYHLPAARTDFIFCLIGERWGTLGVVAVLVLYVLLLGRCLWVAAATREPFGRLIVVGIVTLLGSQVIINTGMTVGLMPVTGLTLPLVSYGGSSLLMTAVAIGLVLNVAIRPGYAMQSDPFAC